MLFIGPTLLSGIGQHCIKYMNLFPEVGYTKYIQIHEDIPESDSAFIFALPIPYWLDKIPADPLFENWVAIQFVQSVITVIAPNTSFIIGGFNSKQLILRLSLLQLE